MKASDFEQVDVVLTEDGRGIWLYGYAKDERCFIQTFDLPMAMDEDNVDAAAWRKAAKPEAWRQL